MSVRVPLRLRPPNPPSPFLGRDDDVARLSTLLDRGPVAIVWGFSGVGKSALVQATLDARGPEALARTVWLRSDGDVLRALSACLVELGADAGAGVADVAEDVAEALEATGLQVVVDGIERLGDDAGLAALARLLSRHARRARLLCICREDPRDAMLLTRTLRVAPLGDDVLARLVDTIAPGQPKGARRALVQAAQGSPWRLVQLTLDGGGGVSAPEASLLALSPVARGLLATLALADVGLPLAILQQATRLPDDEALRALSRRGWLERVGDVLHLHHAAVALVAAGISSEERRRRRTRLLDALLAPGGHDRPVALALRLAREVLDDEGAAAAAPHVRQLVRQAGPALCARGEAPALWALAVAAGLLALDDDDDVTAAVADLAVDVGDSAVALAVDVGRRGQRAGAAGRMACAALAHAGGDQDNARALLRTLPDDTDLVGGDGGLLGRALALALERGDDDIVDGLVDRAPAPWRPALAALRERGPGTVTTSPLSLWPTLPAPLQAPLLPALGRALLAAGRVDDALGVVGDGGGGDTAHEREIVLVQARARALAGDPDPWTTTTTSLSADAARALEAGLWRFSVRMRRGLDDDAERARLRLAVDEQGVPPRLQRLAAIVREGGAAERDRRHSADPFVDEVLLALARAPQMARERARALRAAARAGGDRLAALELAGVVGDAMIGTADAAGLVDLARAIRTEAKALSSPRGLDEATLFLALARSDASGVDGAGLAGLAQGGHGALVRRRARLLLGDDVDDAFDRAPWRTRPGPAPVHSAIVAVAGDALDRAWTVDEARRRIVVGHDVVVDLADKGILFGLLVALGRRGGAATKEQLQQDVWGEQRYHPLRHDNRLKVAVRKLRRLLEDALGDDPLEASDDGYRLRGRVRFVSAGG